MWHLHQTAKQASKYHSNTRRSVLKLQRRSTPHCNRDCHPAGDKTKEGCAPHRLPINTEITGIRKPRRQHLSKINTKYKRLWNQEQQPYFNRYLHIPAYIETKWPISWQRKEARSSSPNQTKLPRSKNAHQKQEASWLRLLSRYEQTMIFRLRIGHCRLRSHIKKIAIEESALCPCGQMHKLQPMSCSRVLSTKKKGKPSGQQKVL